jgi:hypothetical protein
MIELRAFKRGVVWNGFYDDPELFAKYARELNAKGFDIFRQVNRIDRESVIEVLNRPAKPAGKGDGTCDEMISRRVTIFYDCDPLKAKDQSGKSDYPASDEEKARVRELADKVRDFWAKYNVRPKEVDSGNGIQLWVDTDLPVTEDWNSLVEKLIAHHQEKFKVPGAKLDALADLARIARVGGYINWKGVEIPGRPHRTSVDLQTAQGSVSEELLLQIISEIPAGFESPDLPSSDSGLIASQPVGFAKIAEHKQLVEVLLENAGLGDKWKWELLNGKVHLFKLKLPEGACPNNEDHTPDAHGDSTFAAFIGRDGSIGAKCLHSHCSQLGWIHVREYLERKAADLKVLTPTKIEVPSLDMGRLELGGARDYIDQLTEVLTEGTPLPPSFVRETAKVFCLALLPEDRPVLPFFKGLHTRQYLTLLSEQPATGKGEGHRRVKATFEKAIREHKNWEELRLLEHIDGSSIGSPEYAVLRLGGFREQEKKPVMKGSPVTPQSTPTPDPSEPREEDIPWSPAARKQRIVYYDEGKLLYQKDSSGSRTGNGLIQLYTKLFENNQHATGSFKNGKAEVLNANVSTCMHFVRSDFERTLTGSGATSDGYLSRCTLVVDKRTSVEGDWHVVDSGLVKELIHRIRECCARKTLPLSSDADKARLEFLKTLRSWDPKCAARLEFLFVQDLYARGIFSVTGEIGFEEIRRAAAWTKHQYQTRTTCWPIDISFDKREQSGALILTALENHPGKPLSKNQLAALTNVRRVGSGGFEVFNRALQALMMAGEVVVAGHTRKKTPLFKLAEYEDRCA